MGDRFKTVEEEIDFALGNGAIEEDIDLGLGNGVCESDTPPMVATSSRRTTSPDMLAPSTLPLRTSCHQGKVLRKEEIAFSEMRRPRRPPPPSARLTRCDRPAILGPARFATTARGLSTSRPAATALALSTRRCACLSARVLPGVVPRRAGFASILPATGTFRRAAAATVARMPRSIAPALQPPGPRP